MIKESIVLLVSGQSLSLEQAGMVMEEIMNGEVTPAQFGAFVTALRVKGETVEEIAGFAGTMKSRAIPVIASMPVVDTCGTGGDNSSTFNISTAAAFVAAAAGVKIAKHGNRAMSSQCGSADVLEKLGVKIDLNSEGVQRCLEEVGIAFMFAPVFHPAMRHAAAPRREIGIRTIFNILGPLTNPASAHAQVLGVPDISLTEKLARVLKILGSHHALVVHGDDGLDEITITGKTYISELKDGTISNYAISPEDLGLSRANPESIKAETIEEKAAILRRVLSGSPGPARDVVLMNAAAALLASDKIQTLQQGLDLAKEGLDSGRAIAKMEHLAKFSRNLK